ncbi:Ribosomal biogenesis protein las1l [Homalodisca vitripennis]|nr:Ribosomal biogenesis protein las1l [Homalodisca vitripennis]
MAAIYQNKGSKLQVVPWFNKKEWQETYHQAYSEDLELQEKAYTQMCIWKTRYPNLPLGVECTMDILYVRLCDKQSDGSASTASYQHRDLQLLYSTAVMRFLNHLTVITTYKDSMYKMAEENRIPDWLINLRHEAAHGNSVPALYLLRQASDVILQWLQDNYWEVEAGIMTDHISDGQEKRQSYCRKITELLELWVVLKVNYWARKRTIDKIPEEDIRFRKRAMELANEEGIGIKRSAEKGTAKQVTASPAKPDDYNEIIEEEEEMDLDESGIEVYTHKIKTAFDPLLRCLFFPLRKKPYSKNFYKERLIDCLVKFEGFCPNMGFKNFSETELSQLMWLQWQLWREVMVALQAHRMLHCLLSRLMALGTSSAHVWLRLFTMLLSGDHPPPPPYWGGEVVCLLLADSLPCQIDPQVLARRLRLKQSPYDLKPPTAQDIQVLQKLAHQAVENPSLFTASYVKSLLRYWEDGLSDKSMALLIELTQIYSGTQPRKGKSLEKVYTMASLLDQGLVVSEDEEENSQSQDILPWQLYSGDADWLRCPLGSLPWQSL